MAKSRCEKYKKKVVYVKTQKFVIFIVYTLRELINAEFIIANLPQKHKN